MKSLTTPTLLSMFLTHLSSSLPQQAIPNSYRTLNGTIPPTGIACVTSKENNTWTAAEITSNLNGAGQSNNIYLPWGIAEDYGAPSSNSKNTPAYIGPNPNMKPLFPAACDTSRNLYYVRLLHTRDFFPQTTDVVVYGITASAINYCGVVTNSDNRGNNGYHQCNAA